jgi:dTDP-glucose pyrophosphorylase
MTRGGVTAVILAAGAGTRLGVLGRRHSKAMLPIAGRPLIARVIERLQRAGVQRLIVVGHPSDAALRDLLQAQYAGAQLVLQPERRGIADALRQALPLLRAQPACLACACDSLFAPADIAAVIARGHGAPGAAAIGILEMDTAATGSRSAVWTDGERVTRIAEKPMRGAPTTRLVAMPLYWLPQSFAPFVDTGAPPTGEAYISTALNVFIEDGGTVLAVPVSWRIEITTAEDVQRAERSLAAESAS